MKWFQQNRFFRLFLVALGVATIGSLWFLFHEKAAAKAARARLETTVNELTRLHRSVPFPNSDNLRKLRAETKSYRASIAALEQKLEGRILPILPLEPNEFQSQLRLAVNEIVDHAATAKVQVPANFNLGFDRYSSSLPDAGAAPRLGQELRAIEWLVNTMINARIDAVTGLSRTPLPEEDVASGRSSAEGRTNPVVAKQKLVASATVELAFSGSPSAVRRVVNELTAAKDQFYIIRSLVVRNQVAQGPKRAAAASPLAPEPMAAPDLPLAPGTRQSIVFIVGTEHLDVAMKVEIVRFRLGNSESR
jgi:hypothetical protein